MDYKVCKFGGSSVASAEQIRKVSGIVRSDPARKYVVVSAPGKHGQARTKVTDLLISLADDVIRGQKPDYSQVIERYSGIVRGLGMSEKVTGSLAEKLEERVGMEYSTRGELIDGVKAFGEEYSARIIAEYLGRQGIEARYADPLDLGLLVTPEFGNARVEEQSYPNLKKSLAAGSVVHVIPGFFGYTSQGQIATFSRGGSDLTGSIVAAAVGAAEYENWTDVDGIFMADPAVVWKPRVISHVTYEELRELSYMGFSVFHDEAMFPVIKHHIPTHLRNTNNPAQEGTRIVEYRIPNPNEVIVGVACKKGFATIDVRKFLMNRELGFIRRAAGVFEQEGISIEHIPSGIDSLSVIVEKDQLENGTLNRVTRRLSSELKADEVKIRDGHALVCAVGQGMIHKTGVAARVTGACSRKGVNIEMINQGASELSITLAVKEKNADSAVNAIYYEFVK